MRETWVWSLGQEAPLEEGTATHSSILAWRIPGKEEPGRLQSMGLQRVGHDWVTKHTPGLQVDWQLPRRCQCVGGLRTEPKAPGLIHIPTATTTSTQYYFHLCQSYGWKTVPPCCFNGHLSGYFWVSPTAHDFLPTLLPTSSLPQHTFHTPVSQGLLGDLGDRQQGVGSIFHFGDVDMKTQEGPKVTQEKW